MKQPRFTLLPGWIIARDGAPLVSLSQAYGDNGAPTLDAHEAQAFIKCAVAVLNAAPRFGAPRSPRLDDMVVITAPDAEPVMCTLGNFITVNAETIGEAFADIFEALEQGETFQGGGGAAGEFTVSLVPAE